MVPVDFKLLTNNELVKSIAQDPRNEQAWREFLSRFHKHICCAICRQCQWGEHRQGVTSAEDLVQEVYQKLLLNRCEALRKFKGRYENSILRFLEIIAIRVVQNDLRSGRARRRPPRSKMVSLNQPLWKIPEARAVDLSEILPSKESKDAINQFELIDAIEYCLQRVLRGKRHKERDQLIFKYYLYQGLDAEAIASLPHIGESSQRIFSIIHDLKQELQKCLLKKI